MKKLYEPNSKLDKKIDEKDLLIIKQLKNIQKLQNSNTDKQEKIGKLLSSNTNKQEKT